MAIHRVWTWHDDDKYFAEADHLAGQVVEARTRDKLEKRIRKRLRKVLKDRTPKLDIRYTTLHKRRAARLGFKGPVVDRADFRALIDAFDLSQFADEILAKSKPAVQIKVARFRTGEAPELGASRFCGEPDLPLDMVWPTSGGRPLTMLAQIRLSELPAFPPEEAEGFALPRTGLLWFWFDTFEEPWESKRGDLDSAYRVTYVADESTPLVRRPLPNEVAENTRSLYKPCGISFSRILSLPWLAHDLMDTKELHRFFDLNDIVEGNKGLAEHKLRNNFFDPDDYVFEDHPNATLLATFGSDEKGPDWGWGDAGALNFWIEREDLQAGRLTEVWGSLDSG